MPDTTTEQVTVETADLANLEMLVEQLEESLADAQLAAEDRGWLKIGAGDEPIDRTKAQTLAKVARVMAVADPLIRRAINLRVGYVWGSGVEIGADGDENGQDVNEVVQAFLDDQAATFSGAQAREEIERTLATDGNAFLALATDPGNGRVQVRTIPDAQVDDIVTDPEDAATPWLYKRTWTTRVVEADRLGTTRTRRVTRTAYYPALGFRPNRRPRTVDGHDILWDTPVLHVHVNRPAGSLFGTPDLYAAVSWAQGYRDFLLDWARLVKALSQFAFRATAKNGRGAAQVRSRIESGAGQVGGTAILPEGHTFEAIGKSGATIDSQSGRPLAAMVAAATDVPVTMLLADPGTTGARAVAETLDKPLELVVGMRRELHGTVIVRVLDHVIDAAIKAPAGRLRGTVRIDRWTGREVVELAGGQARGITVDWPSLEDIDLKTIVEAVVEADGTGYLPEETVARLLLVALHVDNPDEVIDSMRDAEGNVQLPEDLRAARSALAGVGSGRGTDPQD